MVRFVVIVTRYRRCAARWEGRASEHQRGYLWAGGRLGPELLLSWKNGSGENRPASYLGQAPDHRVWSCCGDESWQMCL